MGNPGAGVDAGAGAAAWQQAFQGEEADMRRGYATALWQLQQEQEHTSKLRKEVRRLRRSVVSSVSNSGHRIANISSFDIVVLLLKMRPHPSGAWRGRGWTRACGMPMKC